VVWGASSRFCAGLFRNKNEESGQSEECVKLFGAECVEFVVMKSFEPDDPLWKLLGASREPKVRPNFVQNVVREARNAEQERGWWAVVKAWWFESGTMMPVGRLIAVAAVVVLLGVVGVGVFDGGESVPSGVAVQLAETDTQVVAVVEVPLVPEVETQMKSLDSLDELLAVEDTSGLTDRQIAFLLY
jgi:hypothetical protein